MYNLKKNLQEKFLAEVYRQPRDSGAADQFKKMGTGPFWRGRQVEAGRTASQLASARRRGYASPLRASVAWGACGLFIRCIHAMVPSHVRMDGDFAGARFAGGRILPERLPAAAGTRGSYSAAPRPGCPAGRLLCGRIFRRDVDDIFARAVRLCGHCAGGDRLDASLRAGRQIVQPLG